MGQSHPKLVSDDESDSGELNKLQTKSVQKPLEGIDQVRYSIKEDIQDFAEGVSTPNKRFPGETNSEKKVLENQTQLMQNHYHINHLRFSKLKAISKLGITKSRSHNVKPPRCPDCKFGRHNRTPYSKKG